MSGVPPVTLPSIVKTPSFRAPADRVSVTSICHPGGWTPANPDGTESFQQRPELNPPITPIGSASNVFRIPPSTSLNPLAQQNPNSSTRPPAVSPNATFSSNLNQFVSVHPVFTNIATVPVPGTEKDNDTRPPRLELTPTAGTPTSNANGIPAPPVTRSKSGTPTKTTNLRWTDGTAGGDSASPEKDSASSQKKTSRLRCAKEHQEAVWRRIFLQAGSTHAVKSDFADAMVVPNLQFGDRLLEAFYAQEYFRKGMRWRVVCMVSLAIVLIGFQLWFGISKAVKHLARQNAADYPASSPLSDPLFFIMGPDAASRKLNAPCLAWSNPSEDDVKLPNNIYMAACIDQVVVDLSITLAWLITVFIRRLEGKMEAISIFIQLFRTGCFIFFAQGMWSACARSQGPADIMMNNIAIASANLSAFNVVGLGRVRRACFVTLAWFAGLIEVSIVMTQSSSGKSQLTMEDAPQLTLFIIIFLAIPVATLYGRYRAEFGEREALYYAVMLAHTRQLNTGLHNQLAEMEAVKEVDIERALPQGLVASRIVQVAVMELKGADKMLDAVQSCITPLMANLNVAGAPLDNSPNSRTNELIKYDSSQNFHGIFSKSHKWGPREQQQRTSQITTDIQKQSSAFFPRRESAGVSGPWTKLGDLHQRLCTAQTNAQNIHSLQGATNEMRQHIQQALKLLSRSHDLFTAKPQSDYEDAMLFHALGHDGYKGGARGYQPSASTSRQTSFRLGNAQSQQTFTACASAGAMSLPSSMQMPLHPEMGDAARNIGQTWLYDMLKVTRITKDQAIATTAILLAGPIAERFSDIFDWQCWMNFILAIQKEYGPSDKIPYHNRTHAAVHAHATSILLSWLGHAESSGPLESIALLAASLCHDVGHPGRTNAFLVNANKRLALTYNDIAVLENHHASLTFTTLYSRGNNFLSRASQEDYRFFRKTVIELILSTDMKSHEEIVNAFRLQRNSADFDCWVDSCRIVTLKMIVKGADLAHGAFDWPIHQQLSMAVTEEFWSQGDAEERLGLPKSPLCDRTKPQEVAKSQIGFLEFVVLPLYTELAHADPSGRVKDTCETMIRVNMSKWKVMAASHTLSTAHPLARQNIDRRAASDDTPITPPASEFVAISDSPSFSPIMSLNTPPAAAAPDVLNGMERSMGQE